jgi:hypothetical protein
MFQCNFLSIAILFFFCIANPGCSHSNNNSKNTIHDTILVEKKFDEKEITGNKLIGTTVLKLSEKNVNTGRMHDLWLENVTASECMGSMEDPLPTKITSIKQPTDSTLVIKANIDANCSHDFLGEAEVLHGNTLNLIYHGYGGYAQCNCVFELTYTFELPKESINKPNQIKYVTLDGVSKTPFPKIKYPRSE